ncbi:hypothetical protein AVDCRST_MAG92-1586 [uncultured Coleofasciculus sp.]|uniref:Uncharacterized protein n=1 Tax=uncultured Coleofasciculus sp. TaxID=1267456 RepID=A0A6J4I6X2_9CYAN|nr:hypothetical protein AVDCRST_MAG92-1586 [uncultured Coleofasciculus sp.]
MSLILVIEAKQVSKFSTTVFKSSGRKLARPCGDSISDLHEQTSGVFQEQHKDPIRVSPS